MLHVPQHTACHAQKSAQMCAQLNGTASALGHRKVRRRGALPGTLSAAIRR